MNEYPKMLWRKRGGVEERHIVHDLAGENMAADQGWCADRKEAKEYDPDALKAAKQKAQVATADKDWPAPSNAGKTVSGKGDDQAPVAGTDRKTQPGQPHPPGGFKEEIPPSEDPLKAEKAQDAIAKAVDDGKSDKQKASDAKAASDKAAADEKARADARAKALKAAESEKAARAKKK